MSMHTSPEKILRARRHVEAIEAVADGILVLASRDGLAVTPELARERANNIVMILEGTGFLR